MSTISSMTGYGEGRAENERIRVSVSIRTVNHRFLDLSLRLPDAYRGFELDLANRIKLQLVRGRVEARIRVDPVADPSFEVKVRHGLAQRYLTAAAELAGLAPGAAPALSAADLLRLPEVVAVELSDDRPGEVDRDLLMTATTEALDGVLATRGREGAHLDAALRERLNRLDSLRLELADNAPALKAGLMAALETRLQELLADRALDPTRVAQEAAVLADRTDVQEELDRLAAHIAAFNDLRDGKGGRGKQMDFLTQEILRELNTLGAKCRNSDQLERVVEAKVVCEQLREQVQNIE